MSDQVEVVALPYCDFCPDFNPTEAEYDGKTTTGPWANMCKKHFATYGIGLGTGRGQRLVLKET